MKWKQKGFFYLEEVLSKHEGRLERIKYGIFLFLENPWYLLFQETLCIVNVRRLSYQVGFILFLFPFSNANIHGSWSERDCNSTRYKNWFVSMRVKGYVNRIRFKCEFVFHCEREDNRERATWHIQFEYSCIIQTE